MNPRTSHAKVTQQIETLIATSSHSASTHREATQTKDHLRLPIKQIVGKIDWNMNHLSREMQIFRGISARARKWALNQKTTDNSMKIDLIFWESAKIWKSDKTKSVKIFKNPNPWLLSFSFCKKLKFSIGIRNWTEFAFIGRLPSVSEKSKLKKLQLFKTYKILSHSSEFAQLHIFSYSLLSLQCITWSRSQLKQTRTHVNHHSQT